MNCIYIDKDVDEQLHLRENTIFQLKQRIEKLESENEELKSQYIPALIKIEGIPTFIVHAPI